MSDLTFVFLVVTGFLGIFYALRMAKRYYSASKAKVAMSLAETFGLANWVIWDRRVRRWSYEVTLYRLNYPCPPIRFVLKDTGKFCLAKHAQLGTEVRFVYHPEPDPKVSLSSPFAHGEFVVVSRKISNEFTNRTGF